MILTCTSCQAKNRIPPRKLEEGPKCGKCKGALTPCRAPVVLESGFDLNLLIEGASLPVLVDFWAPWCAPCRAVAPELVKLAADRAGKLIVAKVDTEALPQVGATYSIRSIPTFIAFRGGEESGRISGAASGATIVAKLGL